jgi:hypothetical protein
MDDFDQYLFEGPWRNDACMGYAMLAIRRAGGDERDIRCVLDAMHKCFDEVSVEDAAKAFAGGGSYGPVDV